MDAAEAFRQLQLRFTHPIQFDYAVIRPILLEDLTVAERSRHTEKEVLEVQQEYPRRVAFRFTAF